MSLVALALRMATVKALTGRTYAEQRVFDSAIADLDVQVEDEKAPFLVVYTDDEDITPDGKDLAAGTRKLTLIIHAVVASAIKTKTGETSITIPPTDEGLEVILDLTRFDALRELQSFGGEWGNLWRNLVLKVSKITTRRGASAKKGVRFAAREIALELETIADSYPGLPRVGPWADIDTLFRADGELVHIADLIDERRGAGGEMSFADRLRATLGLSRQAAQALTFRDAEGNPVVFQ